MVLRLHRPWLAPLAAALALVAALALAACGASTAKGPSGSTAARPTAERSWPASRFVPADASYALLVARVSDGAAGLRELVAAVGATAGQSLPGLQNNLRMWLGVDFTTSDDLARIGIDPDGGAALFSQGAAPTLALPVSDAAMLQAFIDRLREGVAAAVQPRGGFEVASVQLGDGFAVEWSLIDGYVLVHVALGAEPELAWFDAALTATRSDTIVSTPLFAEALAATRRELPSGDAAAAPAVLGLVRVERALLDGLAAIHPAVASCTPLLAPLERRLFLGATIDDGNADAVIVAPLTAAATAALSSHVAAPPGAGYLAFRAVSPLIADWAIDVDWLAPAIASVGCQMIKGFRLPPGHPRSVHLAVQSADVDQLEGRGAAWLDVRSKKLAETLLSMIPQRRFFEHSSKVAGVEVTELSIPMAPDVFYLHADDRFVITVGDEVMDTVLGPGGAAAEPPAGRRELAHFFLAPHDAASILDAMIEVGELVDFAVVNRRTIQALQHFRSGELDLSLTEGDVPAVILRAASRSGG